MLQPSPHSIPAMHLGLFCFILIFISLDNLELQAHNSETLNSNSEVHELSLLHFMLVLQNFQLQ